MLSVESHNVVLFSLRERENGGVMGKVHYTLYEKHPKNDILF